MEASGSLSDGFADGDLADGDFAEEGESAGRNPLVSELISETGFSELHPTGVTIAVMQAVPMAKPIAD
jgi:hypothetical protein